MNTLSGQSLGDRVNAARYAISGQGLARVVCKATTEELIAPKKKHIDCKFLLFNHKPIYYLFHSLILISIFHQQ